MDGIGSARISVIDPDADLETKVLENAFLDEGPAAGWPVILAYGFPYDVHAYDEVVPRLTQAGVRAIVPYLHYGHALLDCALRLRHG